MRHPLSWRISLSRILSYIHLAATKVGHQTIILLLQMDRVFGNTKQRVAQGIRRFGRVRLLPISTRDVRRQSQPLVSYGGRGLRVRVWNLDNLRRENVDNARCVGWILRRITDPEAIDSAIRLAGIIRWFDSDSSYDPPFDLIVSTFEACFDSAKQVYPGMRDRAYFSARAILRINLRARVRSQEHASKYHIPILAISLSSFGDTDPDFHHVIHMLACNMDASRPTLDFLRMDKNTYTHSLWLLNLFVDLTLVGPNPILQSSGSYLTMAKTDNQAIITDILLMWYVFLGGHVEEETVWAVDKSYAVVLSVFSAYLMLPQRFIGIHPVPLVYKGDGHHCRWKSCPTSQIPP